ncbi:RluA family pseudouridine synthase [Jeotgalibacillus sp. ET6]|uniref:RluA family pseudouridine synthase n=1 Tax=Jeotgalibacillus sp. ET6 TaxID=3037260 RepID=UPI0024183938|nr:RluA family pseudouridine synthase [Jeotgalibacillus sp. ET6]MDG5473364.1 RluA family pseudouridine synthase [Jeotgalibacillus sp. ET6]
MHTSSFSISVPAQTAGKTVEEALRSEWKFGKKQIHAWRMNKAIDLNGTLTEWRTVLSPGDLLTIRLEEEEKPSYLPDPIDLSILYEDEHLLIANKPPHIDTHPNQPDASGTLANGVVHYLRQKGKTGYAQPIHRLDRDTTGTIIFAKHAAVKPLLDHALEQRSIKRTYWAHVHGDVSHSNGTIDQPIGNDRHHNSRKRISPTGQKAITHFRKIQFNQNQQTSWLELQLDTGRTHQIRVHLSSIGHPLAGDTLYGGKKTIHFPFQALHAVKISFTHPFTAQNIVIETPDPVKPGRFYKQTRK